MPPATPPQTSQPVTKLPRPAKPDYANLFVEPAYPHGCLESELDDEDEQPAASRVGF